MHSLTRLLLPLLLLSSTAPWVGDSANAGDWTHWRGPHHDGSSAETGLVASWSPEGENLIWRTDFRGRSTPVVFDGRVCAMGRRGEGLDRQETVACFDAATGKLLWEHRHTVNNTTVPYNRVGWASPAADPETGYLYAQGGDGQFWCFDRDGKVVWQRAMHEELGRFSGYGGRTAGPVVFEDLVLVNNISSSWGKLGPPRHRWNAFNKRTGEMIWWSSTSQPETDKNTLSVPVIATIGGRELMICGAADGAIYALEPRTGRQVWSFQLSKRGINASVVVAGDRVIASHSEENIEAGIMGRVVAIDGTGSGDVTKTHELWRVDELTAGYSSPAIAGDLVLVVGNAADVHALDLKTGKQKWVATVGTVGKGAPTVGDGKVYVTEVNGRVSILNLADGKLLDREDISMPGGRYAEIYGSPAIADGRVFFTTEEGFYCIGDKNRKPAKPAAKTAKASPVMGTGPVASALVVPAEVLIEPGQSTTFRVHTFDAKGRPLGVATDVVWSLEGLRGEIKNGELTVNDTRFQVGHVLAKAGEMNAVGRVRVIAPPPWTEDFETSLVDKPMPHWIYAGRFKVAEKDGSKVLNKYPVASGLLRTRTYLGPAKFKNYTIQADISGTQKGRTRPDMGVGNSGYTLELMGSHQRLEITSWEAARRMTTSVPFAWDADKWYTMKLRVDGDGKSSIVLGKVWPRGDAEPEDWSIVAEDPIGVQQGAPAVSAYSPVDVYWDNIAVTPNQSRMTKEMARVAATKTATPSTPMAERTAAADPARAAARKAAAAERLAKYGKPAMYGGTPDRNMISNETNIADDWDLKTGRNIKWVAKLGSQAYGGPVVYGDTVYIGTNNESPRDGKHEGDRGVVMAFDRLTGEFKWQLVHPKLPAGRVNDWPLQGVCSTPFIDGDRLYYVSNEAQVVCADIHGFEDDENDPPVVDEPDPTPPNGDVVWRYDMIGELDVFPHNLAVASPLAVDGTLFIITGNGVDEGHVNIPTPFAPSFIAVDQETGELIWADSSPGENILHGSWANPAYGVVGGVPQVIFPGGDGWIYSLVPETGKLLWKFDGNPKDSVWELGGSGTRNNIIASPVIHDGIVYIAVGQDPEHGEGEGHLWAIDASKRGDITGAGAVWHRGGDDFHRTISTVAVKDGLLFAADLSGNLYCLDPKTGELHWKYEAYAAVWGSPFVVDGKVYLTDEDGDVAILRAGKKLEVIREINMENSVYTTPVVHDGILYIASRSKLFAIQNGIPGRTE